MFLRICLPLLLAFVGVSAAEPPVQLLLPSRTLEPKSTFEVRFADEMVAADQLGKPTPASPLIFQPSIEGSFVWLSTRSGTFAPSGMLPLGTKFAISLRPGLRNARGAIIAAKLHETAETPPMRVKGVDLLGSRDPENATVVPRFLILFNANVEAAAAAKFFRYEDAAGNRVAARVEQANDPTKADRVFPLWDSDDRSLSAWSAKPEPAEPPDPENDDSNGDDSTSKASPVRRDNVLFVAPVKPLPPGNNWRLIVDPGIPANEWKTTLAARREEMIGDIKAFAVKEVTAEANHIAGRRVVIDFSKSVSPELKPETVGHWVKIDPVPKNFSSALENQDVILHGDFALGVKYRVTVAAGFPASQPTATAATFRKEVAFEKFESRLYFPDFSTHQYLRGSRRLRLLSVNVPRLRVSARFFTGEAVPIAVKAFDKYQEPNEQLPDESYQRINTEALPGKVIWQKDFTTVGAIDSEQTVALDWDEIVGANHGGAVLFTAESLDPVSPSGKRVGAQTLVQLTDIGAAWKRDREETWLHVFSLASGKVISRARLVLLDDELSQLAEARADEQGDAKLPHFDTARWAFVQTGDDAHLIALNSGENDIPIYRLGVAEEDSDEEGGADARSIFLLTERGVYKPGDTVHLKGYAQDPRADHPRIPAGETLTLKVNDAKGREIFSGETTVSDFGSFAQEIKLPEGTLGKYQVVAVGEKGDHLGGSCYFQVQEYKPNAFEILIPAPPVTIGDTHLALPIAAKYFVGKPLSKAKLVWSLVARDEGFAPADLPDFIFCNGIMDFRLNRALDRISQFNAQGDVAIADNGVAEISSSLPVNPKAPQPRAAKLLCEVTDLNQQTVSESRAFVQQSSEFYFGLRRIDSVVREGEPLPIDLITVLPDGKPLSVSVPATIRLTRINWQTNRLATAGDTSDFESKAQLEKIWERPLATVPGLSAERKPNSASLTQALAGKPGEYLLEAVGRDASGHEILTSLVFEVSGEAETDWNYRNPYAIDLVTDKDSYEAGETATVMVKTPIAGDALVTVERDRVLRSFIVPLTGNAPSVQVPLLESDAPNVFVSVMLLRGANDSPRKIKTPEYRIGYANLKVARAKDKLTVTVQPSAPATRPGEKLQLEAEVHDSLGRPATDAEVVLYAVDEGVLSLTGYENPDPLAFFNQVRGLGVSTSLTLPTLLRDDLAEADFANKGYLVGDGKGGPALLNGLRKNFLACPFWNATLRSDAQGRVHAEFTVPDSLTRYRVIAVAATRQSQFGVAQSSFEINKPVMIESAMPAFANVGDKLILRAVVHNTTETGGAAEVQLHLDARAQGAQTARQFSLGAHASVPIDFPVEISGTGKAQWSWSVKFNPASGAPELRDAVQAEIKLDDPAPLIRQVQSSRADAGHAELLRITDPQIIEGTGDVTVALSNTRVVELREALRQLLHYPYGCVEQTTSNMLPWLTVRDLRETLPELQRSDEEIAAAVNHGIQLLLSMQTSSGGLSYWPKGRAPMLWGSAYGGLGLTLAKRAGFAVPDAEYKQLLKYLSEQLRGTASDASGYGLSDRCLTIYTLALAGVAEPAYQDLLFQKRAKLSAEDRALVALAILQSKGPKQTVNELLRGPSIDDAYVEQWFGSVVRENALQLLAWTMYQPRAPQVDELATELFTRRTNGHWQTTQGNAWSLVALASYLRKVETGPRASQGTVAWADATRKYAISQAAPAVTEVFAINPMTVRAPITLSKTGGQVFSEVTVAARSKLVEQPRQDQGYTLQRRYAKIGDDGKLSAPNDLRVGDRVLVTLDIEARRRATYVALEDPLPSVFAPINPAFKSQEAVAGETLGTDWVSDHSELREDRALFFVDLLNAGHYTLRYLARVVSAGEAIAPSAKIEEMYHPDHFGTTETLRVGTRSLE